MTSPISSKPSISVSSSNIESLARGLNSNEFSDASKGSACGLLFTRQYTRRIHTGTSYCSNLDMRSEYDPLGSTVLLLYTSSTDSHGWSGSSGSETSGEPSACSQLDCKICRCYKVHTLESQPSRPQHIRHTLESRACVPYPVIHHPFVLI